MRATRFCLRLLAPLAALLFVMGVPQAMAGDTQYRSEVTVREGSTSTTTTREHHHGGRVGSDQLKQGEFYKSEAHTWSRSTSKTYFQKSDGSVAARDRATGLPVGVTLYNDSDGVEVWGDEVKGWAGKAGYSALGADYKVQGKVGKADGNYYAQGMLQGRAYLLQGDFATRPIGIGNQNLGAHAEIRGDAIVGVEGRLTGTAKAGKDGVTLEAKAEVFAGAKANGQIPLTVSLCKMKASGKLKGEVSAGAGAKATGTISIDWATGTAKISGELAATLGLGAGAGAEITIDLSALVSDPGAVADCLLDGVKEIASAAVELGGDLVDAAGQALSDAGSAIASGTSRAVEAVGGALSDAGSAIAGFFGFGSDPAPPTPARQRGSNTPLNARTRPTTVVIMVGPTTPAGRPGQGLALRANRQAYPH